MATEVCSRWKAAIPTPAFATHRSVAQLNDGHKSRFVDDNGRAWSEAELLAVVQNDPTNAPSHYEWGQDGLFYKYKFAWHPPDAPIGPDSWHLGVEAYFCTDTWTKGHLPVSDAFLTSLVHEAASIGMDPEHLLRVWWQESRLRADAHDKALTHFGLNGLCAALIKSYGADVATYRTWSPEQQLPIVMKDVRARIAQYNHGQPFRSAETYDLANFYPKALALAWGPEAVLMREGSDEYTRNRGIDKTRKGYVQLSDIAAFLNKSASEAGYPPIVKRLRELQAKAGYGGPAAGIGVGGVAAGAVVAVLLGMVLVGGRG